MQPELLLLSLLFSVGPTVFTTTIGSSRVIEGSSLQVVCSVFLLSGQISGATRFLLSLNGNIMDSTNNRLSSLQAPGDNSTVLFTISPVTFQDNGTFINGFFLSVARQSMYTQVIVTKEMRSA